MPNRLAVAGAGSKYKVPGAQPAGFWAGFWHGFIAPITFLVSLKDEDVRIYETSNNGRWYDCGFITGSTILFVGQEGPHQISTVQSLLTSGLATPH